MSDNQDAGSQADAGGQSQADNQSSPQPDQQQGQAPELKEVKDLPQWAQKLVRDLRKESGDYRIKLQSIEDKDKTEAERLATKAQEAEARAQDALTKLQLANARSAVTEAATKANAVSPRAVFALIREGLEFDDDGEPTNVAALLKQAQSDEPSLFRKSGGKGDGGETGANGAGATTDQMNDFIRAQARKVGR